MEPTSAPEPAPITVRRTDQERSFGLLGEVWFFVRTTGKWWLVPVLLALLLVGAVALLSGTGAAPFIYTLF